MTNIDKLKKDLLIAAIFMNKEKIKSEAKKLSTWKPLDKTDPAAFLLKVLENAGIIVSDFSYIKLRHLFSQRRNIDTEIFCELKNWHFGIIIDDKVIYYSVNDDKVVEKKIKEKSNNLIRRILSI